MDAESLFCPENWVACPAPSVDFCLYAGKLRFGLGEVFKREELRSCRQCRGLGD